MQKKLYIGKAEIDITPELGTQLAGYLLPRKSSGIETPLKIKTIILDNSKKIIVYVILDLISFPIEIANKAIEIINNNLVIKSDNIVWASTHTHSGPYTSFLFGHSSINNDWLEAIPQRFASCVENASKNKTEVRMRLIRGFHDGIAFNRRIRFKNQKEINTWLLDELDNKIQSIGSAGVTDPEIAALAFEDKEGKLIAIIFQSSIHPNACEQMNLISGDYPSIVDLSIKKNFGKQATVFFLPGASGDISPWGNSYYVGKSISEVLISKLVMENPYENNTELNVIKKIIEIPLINYSPDLEHKIKCSKVRSNTLKVFQNNLKQVKDDKQNSVKTIIQAWRIGKFGFVSLPGEIFSEIGMRIKKDSPFDWTFPVSQGGDYRGYLLTKNIWETGGYESLIGSTQQPSYEGVEILINSALELLNKIY